MPNNEIIVPKPGLPVNFDIYKSYNKLIPSHWHNHLEVLYIFQGTMQLIRNDEKYTINENDLFIVNSGDIHLTRSLGSVEVLILLIPYELINHSIYRYQPIRFREYFPQIELSKDPTFKKMIDQLTAMRTLYEQGDDGYQFLFISRLYLFLHTLYEYYAISQTSEINKVAKHLGRFKEIMDYVELNFREPIGLKEAASLVSLSPEYFCRTFKKLFGLTFMEYINMIRLTHIHRDILDTDDTITIIQERYGFSNYKVFNRMFKETYGCTPSKLRSRISEKVQNTTNP
jgi:AraC-like DNA-binding protein